MPLLPCLGFRVSGPSLLLNPQQTLAEEVPGSWVFAPIRPSSSERPALWAPHRGLLSPSGSFPLLISSSHKLLFKYDSSCSFCVLFIGIVICNLGSLHIQALLTAAVVPTAFALFRCDGINVCGTHADSLQARLERPSRTVCFLECGFGPVYSVPKLGVQRWRCFYFVTFSPHFKKNF